MLSGGTGLIVVLVERADGLLDVTLKAAVGEAVVVGRGSVRLVLGRVVSRVPVGAASVVQVGQERVQLVDVLLQTRSRSLSVVVIDRHHPLTGSAVLVALHLVRRVRLLLLHRRDHVSRLQRRVVPIEGRGRGCVQGNHVLHLTLEAEISGLGSASSSAGSSSIAAG